MGERETGREYGAVLNCLRAALDRGGEEWMGCISEETSEAVGSNPCW